MLDYKVNLSKEKTAMKMIPIDIRIGSFDEVEQGYTEDEAKLEAERCLDCVNFPCVFGCPINNFIPKFIRKIRDGDFESAYEIISQTSTLPSICSRVCSQETQCESKCTRGKNGQPVGIGNLERFVADWHFNHLEFNNEQVVKNGKKVAVIGSGPSSLTVAGNLALKGYSVFVFEKENRVGGIPDYGIPEFRLPNRILYNEIKKLKGLGVQFFTGKALGKDFNIDDIFGDGFDAIFLGIGMSVSRKMGISGEELKGVISAEKYLSDCKTMRTNGENNDSTLGKNVVVVGGGNVAIDSARTAVRLGAESVTIVYRRSEKELPARNEEIIRATEEGVKFMFLTSPVCIFGDDEGRVNKLKCVKMELGEPDESGRRSPVKIEGSEFLIFADLVIMAIGTVADSKLLTSLGFELDKKGRIVTDESMQTNIRGVFAGGDAVTGPLTVVSAVKTGKIASEAIDKFLTEKN